MKIQLTLTDAEYKILLTLGECTGETPDQVLMRVGVGSVVAAYLSVTTEKFESRESTVSKERN